MLFLQSIASPRALTGPPPAGPLHAAAGFMRRHMCLPSDRSIDIQISRLRQKLGEDARMPQIIKTVRNGGYVLAGQVMVEPTT